MWQHQRVINQIRDSVFHDHDKNWSDMKNYWSMNGAENVLDIWRTLMSVDKNLEVDHNYFCRYKKAFHKNVDGEEKGMFVVRRKGIETMAEIEFLNRSTLCY